MNHTEKELMNDLRVAGVAVRPLNDYAVQIGDLDERVIVTVSRGERGLILAASNSRRSQGARAKIRQAVLDEAVRRITGRGFEVEYAFESPRIKW